VVATHLINSDSIPNIIHEFRNNLNILLILHISHSLNLTQHILKLVLDLFKGAGKGLVQYRSRI